MDNKELRKLLDQLHDEISKTRAVDEKGSAMLVDLDKDIRALIERSEENLGQIHPSFVKNLEGSLEHFEVTHPALTTLISRLLDFLSNTGI
jgi:hypothetical protein